MAKENIREIALDTLIEIVEHNQFSHIYLKQVLDKYAYFVKNERSFINRLVNGTIERQVTLDYIIDSYSKTKVNKMKPLIRTLMRMGAYEIYYMDSVPDSAACNEYVKLAKKRGFQGLSGFCNGVLRSISRGKATLDIPENNIKYSLPQWLWDMWLQQYGEADTKAIASGFFQEEELCIRVNTGVVTPQKLTEELTEQGIKVKASEDGLALYISEYDSLSRIPEFMAGEFYVQDYSSMKVVDSAKLVPGNKVLDVCAAPGGKALHAASVLDDTGMVVARDLTDYKISLIEDNIERSGLKNIKAEVFDATIRDEKSIEAYDVVIADLPCSGLGIIRKKPDIKYRVNKEVLDSVASLQSQILDEVCHYVKAGGKLIYSTCTINRAENDLQVKAFLDRHKEFEKISENQMYPNDLQDGFYICVMNKR